VKGTSTREYPFLVEDRLGRKGQSKDMGEGVGGVCVRMCVCVWCGVVWCAWRSRRDSRWSNERGTFNVFVCFACLARRKSYPNPYAPRTGKQMTNN